MNAAAAEKAAAGRVGLGGSRGRGDEGAEILTSIINRFFEELISIVTRHAGDVIKFAGDAILCIWSSNTSQESLTTLTRRAIACALEQVQKLHNWDTREGVTLQLHLTTGPGTALANKLTEEHQRDERRGTVSGGAPAAAGVPRGGVSAAGKNRKCTVVVLCTVPTT